ncbi:hypothetical protein FQN60_010639 [Etheostoma spectabile]|uniref:Uncharacterized protein n=1 Tax=Etheostoma spectabile TaxID=54343 RepID=A0A5J5CFC8_9PERO|nr:hypothetical protein FQN60_010639 [Etheostoma spectabile]
MTQVSISSGGRRSAWACGPVGPPVSQVRVEVLTLGGSLDRVLQREGWPDGRRSPGYDTWKVMCR